MNVSWRNLSVAFMRLLQNIVVIKYQLYFVPTDCWSVAFASVCYRTTCTHRMVSRFTIGTNVFAMAVRVPVTIRAQGLVRCPYIPDGRTVDKEMYSVASGMQ
jgi:hypothetical protein